MPAVAAAAMMASLLISDASICSRSCPLAYSCCPLSCDIDAPLCPRRWERNEASEGPAPAPSPMLTSEPSQDWVGDKPTMLPEAPRGGVLLPPLTLLLGPCWLTPAATRLRS